jgi:hypothetical protein
VKNLKKDAKIILSALFAAACCMFLSCAGKNTASGDENSHSVLTVKSAGEDSADLKIPTQTWHVSNDRICILFGYGYNDEAFVKSMTKELYKKYGAAENGGLILPLVFPSDFKHGTKSIAAELPLYLDGSEVRGLILFGAPENTNFGVAHLLDSYDGQPVFPVFSFFPQDDVLGMEGTADFVLDKAQEADIDGVVENESEQSFVKEVPDIIRKSVEYILALDAPLAKDKNLYVHLKNITGSIKINRYVDPESGLQSVNHFVMN